MASPSEVPIIYIHKTTCDANHQVQHDPLPTTDKTEACMKTPAVPRAECPPSQETAVLYTRAYVRPAPQTRPETYTRMRDRPGITDGRPRPLHACACSAALQMCICITASPKRAKGQADTGSCEARWVMLCRMEKERWAGGAWSIKDVGSHGWSRPGRARRGWFAPRSGTFVGDFLLAWTSGIMHC